MLLPKTPPLSTADSASTPEAWAAFKQGRRAAGLTQKELAEKLDVHQRAIYAWERGLYAPARKHWNGIVQYTTLTMDQLAAHAANFSPALNSNF